MIMAPNSGPRCLGSKFLHFDQEFREIAVKRLTTEEGISAELATNIIEQAARNLKRKDLQDCIKVSRIARTIEEIASVVTMMK